MEDVRVVVVEKALDSLAHLVEVGGGDFLRRRMKKEAWPILARLIKEGLPQGHRGAKPSQKLLSNSERQAPAILARVQMATIATFDRC